MKRLYWVALKFVKYAHSFQNNYALIKCYLVPWRKNSKFDLEEQVGKDISEHYGKGKNNIFTIIKRCLNMMLKYSVVLIEKLELD